MLLERLSEGVCYWHSSLFSSCSFAMRRAMRRAEQAGQWLESILEA